MRAADLACLLDEDFERNKRHVFTFVNRFRWENSLEAKMKAVEDEPSGVSDDVKALVASLVEFLCREAKTKTPEWAENAPPAKKAVYLVSDDIYKMHAIRDAPVVFRKRKVFISRSALEEG